MPKVIRNVKEMIAKETLRQINEYGIDATTVRSVAKACSVAVGTVYNYYPSKDIMIASVVIDKWNLVIDGLSDEVRHSLDAESAFRLIFNAVRDFITELTPLFEDSDVMTAYAVTHSAQHNSVRRQLADLILPGLAAVKIENRDFTAMFLAETILTWAREDVSFETFWSVARRVL